MRVLFTIFCLVLCQVSRIWGQDLNLKDIKWVKPVYPPLARQAKLAGGVEITIGTNPSGESVYEAIGNNNLLKMAALDNLREWKIPKRSGPITVEYFFVLFQPGEMAGWKTRLKQKVFGGGRCKNSTISARVIGPFIRGRSIQIVLQQEEICVRLQESVTKTLK